MSTTIRVQDDVYAALKRLKRELNAESYNQVIKHLIRKSKRMDKSEFGSMPEIAPFVREEIETVGAKKRQKLLAEADEVRERTGDLGISASELIREDRDAR